ncbi:MAG: hypothetical protein JXR53_12535 [Bacteroidales bacterium]|nr:hypothetical protein [Bacteroidales bacterium]
MRSLVIMLMGVLFIGFTTQIKAQEVVDNGKITVIYSKKPSTNTDNTEIKKPFLSAPALENIEEPGVIVRKNDACITSDDKKLHGRYQEATVVLTN